MRTAIPTMWRVKKPDRDNNRRRQRGQPQSIRIAFTAAITPNNAGNRAREWQRRQMNTGRRNTSNSAPGGTSCSEVTAKILCLHTPKPSGSNCTEVIDQARQHAIALSAPAWTVRLRPAPAPIASGIERMMINVTSVTSKRSVSSNPTNK